MAFPSLPVNGQTYTTGGVTYVYNSTKGVWAIQTYDTVDAAGALTSIKTVDGSGSGLDADTLDGYTSADFALAYANNLGGGMDVWNKVHATWSDSSGANTYIVITTPVPQDSYSMGGFELVIENNYSTGSEGDTIGIYGYWNPESNGGFMGFKYHATNPNFNPTIQVARNAGGATCFIISGESTNYTQIVARNLYLGYSANGANSSWGDGWSIADTSDISGYTNNNTLVRTGILPGSGNGFDADTLDGLHASSFVQSSNGIVFPSYSSDPSSPVAGQTYYNSSQGIIKSWDGYEWLNVTNKKDGLSSATAADSAADILAKNPAAPSGVYWILGDDGTAFEVYCDMTTAGGGWMGIMNIDVDNGVNHHWSDTSWWQGDNTTGTAANFLTQHHKNAGFKKYSNFTEIMVTTHQSGTYRSHGTWTLLSQYFSYSWYDLLNIAQSSAGTKITGNRTGQGGDSGFTNNPNRGGNSAWRCEFTDSAGGYELRVNWYGTGYYAKYSRVGDTVNYARIATGLGDYYGPSGDGGYEHSYSGFGGHHERPAGSYVINFDFAAYTEYCDTINFFSTNAGNPCNGSSINVDGAIWVR